MAVVTVDWLGGLVAVDWLGEVVVVDWLEGGLYPSPLSQSLRPKH